MATPSEQQIIHIIEATPWLMQALRTAASIGWQSWCIGAGAVRSAVWESLHGRAAAGVPPAGLGDVDLVYFDAGELRNDSWRCAEKAAQRTVQGLIPTLQWEVVNQAAVHCWYRDEAGQPVPAFSQLDEALASWPEVATCIGAYLDESGAVQLVAPLGVDDLLALRVRHNPRRASLATYRDRMQRKQWQARWHLLTVEMPGSCAINPVLLQN